LDVNRSELRSSATCCVFYILRERFVIIYLEQNIRISSITSSSYAIPRAVTGSSLTPVGGSAGVMPAIIYAWL
jgi:hypothetical protein